MATTSLWHIKGRLKDLINYVENPEKTKAKAPELQDLYNVFTYVQRPEATQKGEYITALNCLKETALRQMILTKKRYGKTDGYIAWHGYQSFKPEEVTPQLAHEIGVKLAKEIDADGVHLGQDDLDIKAAREYLGADKIIGVSAHNVKEALEAENGGADYLGSGAAFVTSTKTDAGAIDHKVLSDVAHSVKIPVVAIGGINKDNISQLEGLGLDGVAVVSAIFAADDISSAVIDLKAKAEKVAESSVK